MPTPPIKAPKDGPPVPGPHLIERGCSHTASEKRSLVLPGSNSKKIPARTGAGQARHCRVRVWSTRLPITDLPRSNSIGDVVGRLVASARLPKQSILGRSRRRLRLSVLSLLWVTRGHESANQDVCFPTQKRKRQSSAPLVGGIVSFRLITGPPPLGEAYSSGLRSRSGALDLCSLKKA